ncbi:hypothetical protein PFISCL1PPCAC_11847 [Pristionchus fissidentatus]|uniref:GPN-loop GTPase 3 n=1 Tax=Pristionchus fissidentatus TaxID=1538716 RepID=A0AAV5VRD4_9BILA|nr:hypothetical protein PFISCL1PPCAC_11847 [Pristionchus fissidentatus]
MKCLQLIIGPAGSGKSTFCSVMFNHFQSLRRPLEIVNLDPAAETFNYTPSVDIRDLISVDDVLEDEDIIMGPNGGLVFCMEYISQNMEWIRDQLTDGDDAYVIVDCPGQIELYSHLPIMKEIVTTFKSWDYNVCTLFMIDAHFVLEPEKLIAGALTALSSMVSLETSAVNVLTKMDQLSRENRKEVEDMLESDCSQLVDGVNDEPWNEKHAALTRAIATVLDDYSMFRMVALDNTDEESIEDLLLMIDTTIQYGEDAEVHDRIPEEVDPEEE